MTNCIDDGRLRAYLDGELPALERAAVGAHIAGCPSCRAELDNQRALAAQARALLATPAPDPHAALARLRGVAIGGSAGAQPQATTRTRRPTMQSGLNYWAGRRAWLGGLAALVAIVSLLALPPVRAAADQLLGVFRVQKIVFMPISPDRIQQLRDLDLKGGGLFVGRPEPADRTPPRQVASADAAAQVAGYPVAQITNLPSAPSATEFHVIGANHTQVQVNVAAARQLLDALDIRDVSLPDALGAQPIAIATQPFVAARYQGAGYDLTLSQGQSPNVTLPDGVELSQLGKVALRVIGMTPEQAEIASRQINWSNTLIFPFPADADNIRQVTVGGEPALLVGGGRRDTAHWQLYWQHGDRLFMLASKGTPGTSQDDLIATMTAAAESVR
jgi:hypothetical protein